MAALARASDVPAAVASATLCTLGAGDPDTSNRVMTTFLTPLRILRDLRPSAATDRAQIVPSLRSRALSWRTLAFTLICGPHGSRPRRLSCLRPGARWPRLSDTHPR